MSRIITKPITYRRFIRLFFKKTNKIERICVNRSGSTYAHKKIKMGYAKKPGFNLLNSSIFNLDKVMSLYVATTKSTVGYYIKKSKSFKKKKKIFKVGFMLKILKRSGMQKRLYKMIQVLLFRKIKGMRNAGLVNSTNYFVENELLLIGKSNILKKKIKHFESRGEEALYNIIIKYRLG